MKKSKLQFKIKNFDFWFVILSRLRQFFKKGIGIPKSNFSASLLSGIFAFCILNLTGCAPLIVGGAVGALGGYAVSKDTIQADTDKSYDILWNSALRVSRIRGQVKQEDISKGYIELEAESSRIYIRLIKLTPAKTKLRVSARKYHLPNLGLAQDIFVKIMEEAR